MSTQKDLVYEMIQDETQKNIINGTYNFEELNAMSIGIDLMIDRSNVSRILNVLHSEGKLIRQKGRPTIYVSKDIFMKKYPYLSLPSTLEIGDDIRNYVNISNYRLKPQIVDPASYNDLSYDDVLYSEFKKIFPIFFCPSEDVRVLMLVGEIGVGKKYLLEQTLEGVKKAGIMSFNQELLYYKHLKGNLAQGDYLDFLKNNQDRSISSICVEIKNEESSTFVEYIQITEFFFKNIGQPIPTLTFSIEETNYHDMYHMLTPFTAYIPSLRDRPLKSRLYLILHLLQNESVRLNKTIVIHKKVLKDLLGQTYKYNVRGLKMELLYAITYSIANRVEADDKLTLYYTSKLPRETDQFLDMTDDVMGLLPESMIINPRTSFNLELLINTPNRTIKQKDKKTCLLDLLCEVSSTVTSISINDNDMDDKQGKIIHALKESNLKEDGQLIIAMTDIILRICNNSFDINHIQYNKKYKFNYGTEVICKRIFRGLKQEKLKLNEKEFIKILIYTAMDLINQVKIPVLITSSSHEMNQNFAKYFNSFMKQRLFYTLPSNDLFYDDQLDIDSRIQNISKSMNTIDKGNGTLLINDIDKKSKEYKTLLLDLRSLSFSINFTSVESIVSIIDIMKDTEKNVVSLSPLIIKSRKVNQSFFQSSSLNNPKERELKFTNRAQPIFKQINVKIMTEVFYELLKAISIELSQPLTNSLIIDFLFMGNCIINNRITQKEEEKMLESKEKSEVYRLIEDKLMSEEMLKDIVIYERDVESLCTIMQNHMYK